MIGSFYFCKVSFLSWVVFCELLDLVFIFVVVNIDAMFLFIVFEVFYIKLGFEFYRVFFIL